MVLLFQKRIYLFCFVLCTIKKHSKKKTEKKTNTVHKFSFPAATAVLTTTTILRIKNGGNGIKKFYMLLLYWTGLSLHKNIPSSEADDRKHSATIIQNLT